VKNVVKTKLKRVILAFFTYLLCNPPTQAGKTPGQEFRHFISWAGATHAFLWAQTASESGVAPAQQGVLPMLGLRAAQCASPSRWDTSSSSEVNGAVNVMVNRVFHAPFTPALEKAIELFEIADTSTSKEASKMEKLKRKV